VGGKSATGEVLTVLIAAGWIQDGWIFSDDPSQSGKFWIQENWIWGPKGAADENTQHWIANGWIFGPAGAEDVHTGFRIHEGWIYGPSSRLPFAAHRWG
jgi:hypothetical protein